MNATAEFETVYLSHDPLLCEMLEDVLETEGFYPRLLGTRNAALLGAGQQIMELRIEVPAGQGPAAIELIAAVLAEQEAFADDGDAAVVHDPRGVDDGPTVERPDDASGDRDRRVRAGPGAPGAGGGLGRRVAPG